MSDRKRKCPIKQTQKKEKPEVIANIIRKVVTSPPKFSNRLQRSTTYSMKASLLFNPIAFSCGEPTYLVPAAQMPPLSFRLLTES